MKKFAFYGWIAVLTLGLFTFSACTDDEEAVEETEVSNEEAFEQIKSAIKDLGVQNAAASTAKTADDNDGFTSHGEIEDRTGPCDDGAISNDTIITDATSGLVFEFDWTYEFMCVNSVLPTSLDYDRTTTGTITNTIFTWTGSAEGDWNIDLTQEDYLLIGTYDRTGTTQSHIFNQNTYTGTTNISVSSITIDKNEPYNITGGIATASYSGDNTNGNSFSVTGDIVFNGDNSATVTINGEDFTINW